MNEKRNDEQTPLTDERPRGIRQNVSSLTGLFLIFIAAVWYGSYFYGVPGHAVKSQAGVILAENPLIDGHNDLLILVRALYDNKINGENFTKAFEKGGLAGHVDVPRLKQGQQGGAFWSAFVPCPANGLLMFGLRWSRSISSSACLRSTQTILLFREVRKRPSTLLPKANLSLRSP
jgi:membrane dipeptidase